MHQKQPPAKTAVFVAAGTGVCPWLAVTRATASTAQPNARKENGFIFSLSCRSGRMLFNMFPVHSGGCSINADTTFFNVLELVPELNVARLDFVELFGRHAPLQVDLGCGDGSFLCELAGQFPEKNFLGIVRLPNRVQIVRRKMLKIENVRVLGTDALFAVRYLLPENSVETFYLFFPDPWPKRRHRQRRIFTCEFLDSIAAAL